MKIRRVLRLFLAFGASGAFTFGAAAGWKDDIGYTQLQNELGSNTPTGASVQATMVEVAVDGNYMPDVGDSEFTSKTITNKSGSNNNPSSHATTVGRYYFGTETGISGGITVVDAYEANDWIGIGFLRAVTSQDVKTENRDLQNHSWIGTTNNDSWDTDILARVDRVVYAQGKTIVVGTNNGSSNPLPKLLAQSYNAIVVGRTDGNHAAGQTTIYGAGRYKPDIVAPLTATSWATPVVAGAAALLMDTARGQGWSDAQLPETVKALLLAGATKSEFSTWDRTPTRPLDDRYGAGELNIYNSYHILTAGQQAASTNSYVNVKGWDRRIVSADGSQWYHFQVPAGQWVENFSVVLSWLFPVQFKAGQGVVPGTLTNLDLTMWITDGSFNPTSILDYSASTVDNVEHVYRTALNAGYYALEVKGGASDQAYALAWTGTVIPEPGSLVLILLAVVGIRSLRRAA